MNSLIVNPTQDTPEVVFDAEQGKLLIAGTSIPENARAFFEPMLNWISEYLKSPKAETYISFKMTYFNTVSTKYIFDIMLLAKEIAKENNTLVFNWYFSEDDEDMYEAGATFSKMLRFPFNMVKYKE